MAMLNLGSTDALITIHYSRDDENNDGERLNDTYSFNFAGNRLNTFINNFNTPFVGGNSVLGDEKIHLKGMEGSMAVVDLFPTTEDLEDFIDEFRILVSDTGNEKKIFRRSNYWRLYFKKTY